MSCDNTGTADNKNNLKTYKLILTEGYPIGLGGVNDTF
jgi:hypothetical protein